MVYLGQAVVVKLQASYVVNVETVTSGDSSGHANLSSCPSPSNSNLERGS